MIKVNLLPSRRAKQKSAPSDPSIKQVYAGVAAIAAVGVLVFFAVDRPKRHRLGELQAANAQLQGEINNKHKQLEGYTELKLAAEEAKKRSDSISNLVSSKVVPAHVLHELSKILTRQGPTMSEGMTRLAGNGPDSDPNKRFQPDWDPAHVWLISWEDKSGVFRLEGGAQSESDVTQLAKRLAASVYFTEVSPAGGERVGDRSNGVSYYKFQITGRIAY